MRPARLIFPTANIKFQMTVVTDVNVSASVLSAQFLNAILIEVVWSDMQSFLLDQKMVCFEYITGTFSSHRRLCHSWTLLIWTCTATAVGCSFVWDNESPC